MRLGLLLPTFSSDPERVVDTAVRAERLGYEGVFVFDHLFPPGAAGDRPALEAFTTLGQVTQATDLVHVGTLVARASLRPVGLLAKMAAGIDLAGGGRMILGLGSGDPIDAPEHEAFGLPPIPGRDERRAHLRETAEALKALFAGKPYEGGDLVPEIPGPLLPPPAQPEGPPVWLGGQADDVVRIAARVADGWNGWGMDAESFRAKAALLRAEAAAAGRAAEATWAGIVLVAEDRRELARLRDRRRAAGLSEPAWEGTAEDLGAFLGALRGAGAAWAVVVPAGPADRLALVAESAATTSSSGTLPASADSAEGDRSSSSPTARPLRTRPGPGSGA